MTTYKRCFSCGKYFPTSNENRVYCSKECKQQFIRCIVCGNYYPIDDENSNKENYICSDLCTKRYRVKKKKDIEKLDFSDL